MYINNQWDGGCIHTSYLPDLALEPLQLVNDARIKVTSVLHPHSLLFASLQSNCAWASLFCTLPEYLTATAEEVLQLLLFRTQMLPKTRQYFILKCEHGDTAPNCHTINQTYTTSLFRASSDNSVWCCTALCRYNFKWSWLDHVCSAPVSCVLFMSSVTELRTAFTISTGGKKSKWKSMNKNKVQKIRTLQLKMKSPQLKSET